MHLPRLARVAIYKARACSRTSPWNSERRRTRGDGTNCRKCRGRSCLFSGRDSVRRCGSLANQMCALNIQGPPVDRCQPSSGSPAASLSFPLQGPPTADNRESPGSGDQLLQRLYLSTLSYNSTVLHLEASSIFRRLARSLRSAPLTTVLTLSSVVT